MILIVVRLLRSEKVAEGACVSYRTGAMPRRGLVAGPDFSCFKRRYFTPSEVAEHNQPEDLWVSYLGFVYNLTPLVQEFKGDLLLKPILEVAGQDISHWFDPKTKDVSSVGVWGWWKRPWRAGEGWRGITGIRNTDCSRPSLQTLAFEDSQAHRSTDWLREIPHPARPLRAYPASSAPFRLGQ